MKGRGKILSVLLAILAEVAAASATPHASANRVFEWTFESRKIYEDPFNDVDVDVIFTKDGESWRVPTFWRGGGKWSVRFAPPTPGEYKYCLESTDPSNPDLNGHEGRVTITAYAGTNALLRHGMLRVSANKRYFEHTDGTPFYWLGDTWWTGLSDRLPWEGFQKLTADRKAKSFTVIQIVAGLVPSNEELAPSDPGFCNEGGCAWQPEFKRINPQYFDYADRRLQHLIDNGLTPAIVGGWRQVLGQIGVAKMKQHWRYVIARYGAYPVFWIVGGEVYDPPEAVGRKLPGLVQDGNLWDLRSPGWTEVARYVRATDPNRHPLTVHEIDPPFDVPLQDESLTDFDLFQAGHRGWPSIATAVAQLNLHYARTSVTKPLVVGEIGYEQLAQANFADFQRTAFWLAMLNGAAGHTYAAGPTFEAYSTDKPFHRYGKVSFLTWEEGMNLPGSYQVGLNATLLRQYPWWRFEPHPEWITTRGTTLLTPRTAVNGFDVDLIKALTHDPPPADDDLPLGEWHNQHGTFRLPYSAGVPGLVRVIYLPYFGFKFYPPPTVLGLESGVRYHAYYWEPSLGIRFDLGAVERPSAGETIREDKFGDGEASAWTDYGATKSARGGGRLSASGKMLAVVNGVRETNLVAGVDAHSDAEADLVLRYHDADNYLAVVYSSKDQALYLLDRKKGVDGRPLGSTPVPAIGSDNRLTAEVRGPWSAASITDGQRTYTTPIVDVSNTSAGGAGLMHRDDGTTQSFDNFELRKSPTLVSDSHLEKKLYDARGGYRGELSGPGWDDFGKDTIILLDAYRPERLPSPQDWVLVLERVK